MKIRAVASILISSGKPIRAAAEFVSVLAATSYAAIAVAAVPAQTIRAEIYIPQILPLASAATPTDQINKFDIGKVLVDALVTSEGISLSLERPVADTATAADTLAKGVVKDAGTDTTTVSDTSTRGVGKVLADSVVMSDMTFRAFEHPFDADPTDADADPDPVAVFDTAQLITGKTASDAVTATDSAPTFNIAKTPALDAVTAADDDVLTIGKNAGTDTVAVTDDDILAIGKNAGTDTVTIADSFTSTWVAVRTVTDTATATDDDVLAVGKTTSDTVIVADDDVLTIGKNAGTDTATASDALNSLAVGKVPTTDTVTASDSVSNTASKNAGTDTVTMADSAATAWSAARAVTDTVSPADSVSLAYQPSGAVNERLVNVTVMNGENTA